MSLPEGPDALRALLDGDDPVVRLDGRVFELESGLRLSRAVHLIGPGRITGRVGWVLEIHADVRLEEVEVVRLGTGSEGAVRVWEGQLGLERSTLRSTSASSVLSVHGARATVRESVLHGTAWQALAVVGGGRVEVTSSRLGSDQASAVSSGAGCAVTLEDCVIGPCGENGAVALGGGALTVSGGCVVDCGLNAVCAQGAGASTRIEGLRIDGSGQHGVLAVGGGVVRAAACEILRSGEAPLQADVDSTLEIADCAYQGAPAGEGSVQVERCEERPAHEHVPRLDEHGVPHARSVAELRVALAHPYPRVCLEPGTWTVRNCLDLTRPVHLEGGPTRLQGTVVLLDGMADVSLAGLELFKFDGQRGGAMQVTRGTTRAEGCQFGTDGGSFTVSVHREGQRLELVDCTVRAGERGAVLAVGGAALVMQDCTVSGGGSSAIGVASGATAVVTACVVRDGRSDGLRVESGGELTVRGGAVHDMMGAGLVASGAGSRLTATEVRVERCAGRGLFSDADALMEAAGCAVSSCREGAARGADGGAIVATGCLLEGAVTEDGGTVEQREAATASTLPSTRPSGDGDWVDRLWGALETVSLGAEVAPAARSGLNTAYAAIRAGDVTREDPSVRVGLWTCAKAILLHIELLERPATEAEVQLVSALRRIHQEAMAEFA